MACFSCAEAAAERLLHDVAGCFRNMYVIMHQPAEDNSQVSPQQDDTPQASSGLSYHGVSGPRPLYKWFSDLAVQDRDDGDDDDSSNDCDRDDDLFEGWRDQRVPAATEAAKRLILKRAQAQEHSPGTVWVKSWNDLERFLQGLSAG